MRSGFAAFFLLSWILWSPAATPAEVRTASPSGFVVENVEVAPVDPAGVWKALVHDVDRWWPKDHTWWTEESTLSIETRAGGCFCEVAGSRQARHMTVVLVDPPELLRMTGGLGPLQGMGLQGVLDWRLEPIEEGTRIRLRYQIGGYSTDDLSALAPVVDRVQGLQLGGLVNHLRDFHAAEPEIESGERENDGGTSPGS